MDSHIIRKKKTRVTLKISFKITRIIASKVFYRPIVFCIITVTEKERLNRKWLHREGKVRGGGREERQGETDRQTDKRTQKEKQI